MQFKQKKNKISNNNYSKIKLVNLDIECGEKAKWHEEDDCI